MKLGPTKIAAFLKNPYPNTRLVLIYGPDQGLVAERSKILTRSLVNEADDPFSVSYLSGKDIKSAPLVFFDAVTARSLLGGKRVVSITLNTEDISATISSYLENDDKDAVIILSAGELSPRSALRKLVEESANEVSIPCYLDDLNTLDSLINDIIKKNNKSLEFDAKAYLINSLGSNRLVSRNELEKLIVYTGNHDKITLKDVVAIIDDNGALSIDEIIYAVADGDHMRFDSQLDRAFDEGTPASTILRAAIHHFQKLHLASFHVQNGMSATQAIKNIRPPIFYKFQDRFKKQITVWKISKISRSLSILTEAEIKSRSTGLNPETICGRALLSLCHSIKN